jgi:phage gp29-like protein
MPIGVGVYPDAWEKNDTAKNNFLSNIGKLGKGSPSIRAESTKLEFAESNAPASADLYKMFIDYCDTMISMAILTQALTTDTGDKGSFAKTKVGWDMQGILAENDKKYPEDLSKAVIERLYKWNFTGTTRAKYVMYEESIINMEQATFDALLIEKGIVKGFSKKHVMEVGNYSEDDIIMPDEKPEPAPQEFEASEDEIQTIIDAEPKDLNEAMLETLKPIFDMMETATSYDEALKKIAKLYPTMGTDKIDEILKRKLFAAKMYADFKGVK